jgi:hypothetical protein
MEDRRSAASAVKRSFGSLQNGLRVTPHEEAPYVPRNAEPAGLRDPVTGAPAVRCGMRSNGMPISRAAPIDRNEIGVHEDTKKDA